MVALVMALNMLLCKFKEVPIKNDTNIVHLMKITSNIVTFIIEYTITQNGRDISQDNIVDLLSALR